MKTRSKLCHLTYCICSYPINVIYQWVAKQWPALKTSAGFFVTFRLSVMQTCLEVCLASVVDLNLWVHIQPSICTLQFFYSCLSSIWMTKEQSLQTSLLVGHLFLFILPLALTMASPAHVNGSVYMSGFVLNLGSIMPLRQSGLVSSSKVKWWVCSPAKLIVFTIYLLSYPGHSDLLTDQFWI